MSFQFDVNMMLNMIVAAGVSWAAIRADIAAMKIRIDHLERDFYKRKLHENSAQA